MRIYLVRHGETVWNRENRTQGWADIELNATGRRHAAALAEAFRDVPLRAVYASDLTRTMETARAIASRHQLDVIGDPDLRELHQGTLDGLTFEELRRDHAGLLQTWGKSPARVKMPGGESMADLQERAWAAVERVRAAHPEGTVAVVCHNLTIVTVLCRVLGLALDDFRLLRQDVAAINLVEFGERFGTGVLRMNDTAHITAGERFAMSLAALGEARRFAEAALAEDDLRRIVGAAGSAGIPEDAYHVLVLSGVERRRQLGEAWRAAVGAADEGGEAAAALESAPIVLAVLGKMDDPALASRLGGAVQGMRIAAKALGYGTSWLGGAACRDDRVAAALDLAAPWHLTALVPLGVAVATLPSKESGVVPYTIVD